MLSNWKVEIDGDEGMVWWERTMNGRTYQVILYTEDGTFAVSVDSESHFLDRESAAEFCTSNFREAIAFCEGNERSGDIFVIGGAA